MAIVKTYVGTFDANSGNSYTGNIAIDPVASGNSLVVMFEVMDAAQPVVSVSDDQSNTYDADHSCPNWNWDYVGDCFWYSSGGITNAPEEVIVAITDADSEVYYWVFEVDNLEVPLVFEAMSNHRDTGPSTSQHPLIDGTATYDNSVALGFLDYAFSIDPGDYTLDAGTSILIDASAKQFASLYSADIGPAGAVSLGMEIVDGPWATGGALYKTVAPNPEGGLDVILADASSSSTGTVLIQGTLTGTLGATTLSAMGVGDSITGDVVAVLSDATSTAQGVLPLTGTLTSTTSDATSNAAGTIAITGSLSSTLGALTLTAAGGEPTTDTENTIDGSISYLIAAAYGSVMMYHRGDRRFFTLN